MKNRIAVSFQGNDCLRIIPMPAKNGNAEVKFHFFDDSFIIRKFDFNNDIGGLIYIPIDHGQAEHEISYHSANEHHSTPVILPKYKDDRERIAISEEIISLDLARIIVPIPICRITSNIAPQKIYRAKDQHWLIELTDKYNTTDIYIADKDYNVEEMARKYPMIVNFLFPITTIDFLVYGSGMSAEPIFNKMLESQNPIIALQSTVVGNYQFFSRTYQLFKTDAFRMYSKQEYSKSNFIEFFNNIDYLDLLATTNIAYKLTPSKTTPIKAAYEYDLENLKRIGFRRKSILKLEKRFSRKKRLYEKLKKFRSGIIIPS
jgi:hypothetical protein